MGGFGKPYGAKASPPTVGTGPTPAGMSADLYAYRPPKDLGNARLRKAGGGFGAGLRAGEWGRGQIVLTCPPRGRTVEKPPAGYNGVLTRGAVEGCG